MATTTTLPPHVLAIDDDAAMRQVIADYLGENDLRVTTVATGAEMEKVLAEHAIDVVVLDLRLAGEDGMQLAKKLRETSEIPIIIVSGRQDEADRVMGLELGADDYITKPFSPRELMARIRAVLRRHIPAMPDETVAAGGLELSPSSHRVTANGTAIELGPTEFRLLHFFMTHTERVYSRTQLPDQVWGTQVFVEERTVDVHIRRLRATLEPVEMDGLIQTVRGSGYRFSIS